jgi:ParB family chromosome partitioning protein
MEAKAKRRLGRGLEALLGPSADDAKHDGDLRDLKLAQIAPNPYQPRQSFDAEALDELKQSMASSGLLQPVVVRSADSGFELIAGERRLRAAEQLGWKTIPAVVRDVDNRTLLTLALIENLQRDALSPIDEAFGYQRLIEEFEMTQADVAELVGRDRSTVANSLRLLKLPNGVQDMLHQGTLTTGHARALLQLADPDNMPRLAERAVTERLSVRELESLARGQRPAQRRPRQQAGAQPRDPEIRRVEDSLRRQLGTDVFVARRSKNSGRVTIIFYSNDDLARILELILGRPFDG